MARKTPPRNAKGQFTSRGRKSNPGLKSMSVGGVKVYPAAYDAVGIIAGTYFGGAATNLASQYLVGRLPASAQGIGWASVGIGTIMIGRYLKRKKTLKSLPVDYTFIGMSVPMFVEALRQFRAPGFTEAVASPPAGEMTDETAMEGTIQPRQLPGSMGGSLRGGNMPAMAGSLQSGNIPAMGRGRMRMLR